MDMEIVLGQLARRDARIMAGDDWQVALTAYAVGEPDPIDLDGDLRLVISCPARDLTVIDGTGSKPVLFAIPAAATKNRAGRLRWRIERTQDDAQTTLMAGVLVVTDARGD